MITRSSPPMIANTPFIWLRVSGLAGRWSSFPGGSWHPVPLLIRCHTSWSTQPRSCSSCNLLKYTITRTVSIKNVESWLCVENFLYSVKQQVTLCYAMLSQLKKKRKKKTHQKSMSPEWWIFLQHHCVGMSNNVFSWAEEVTFARLWKTLGHHQVTSQGVTQAWEAKIYIM